MFCAREQYFEQNDHKKLIDLKSKSLQPLMQVVVSLYLKPSIREEQSIIQRFVQNVQVKERLSL